MEFNVSSGGSSLPVGMYKGDYLGSELTQHQEFGKGVKFRWKIPTGEHAGEEATVICGLEKPPSPKNRLGRILGGLRGDPVQPGQTVNDAPFVGKSYLLQVGQAPGGNGTRVEVVMPNFGT